MYAVYLAPPGKLLLLLLLLTVKLAVIKNVVLIVSRCFVENYRR